MGAFALLKLRSVPIAFVAVVLALAVVRPKVSEARVSGQQAEASRLCEEYGYGRLGRRNAGRCVVKDAFVVVKQSKANDGGVLAAEIFCRKTSSGVTELTSKTDSFLPCPPPHRVIEAAFDVSVGWPSATLKPPLDSRKIKAIAIGRLPDG
jgi:hypothetical protein